jgi:hypothetical protein
VPPEQQLPLDFAQRFLHLTPEQYRSPFPDLVVYDQQGQPSR